MEIIREAFIEGRETEVPFEKSIAKKNQLKMDIALDNLTLTKRHKLHEPIMLQQVDPNSGKVLRTFPSRFAAAQYIVSNILKNPKKKPVSVTGNMEMCMRSGWKAYGYYWKRVTSKIIDDSHIKTKDKVWVYHRGTENVYNSLSAVAETFGLNVDKIKDLVEGKDKHKGITVRKYNPKLVKMEFSTITAAMIHADTRREDMMKRLIISGKPRNNIIYSVKGYVPNTKEKLNYAVYQGNKKIGTYHTINEVSVMVGQSRSVIDKRRKANKKLGEYNQYTLKLL